MLYLFSFLLIALISIYAIKPTNKTQMVLYSVFIPLNVFIIYISSAYSYYYAGRQIGICLLPALISGIVVYFQLKKKFKNENKTKFPVILVVVMVIALGLGLYQLHLEYSINESLGYYDTNKNNPIVLSIISVFLFFVFPSIFCIKQAEKLSHNKTVWKVLGFIPLVNWISVLPAILCIKQAEKLNRNKILWGILGFAPLCLLNYIFVLIIYLLMPKIDMPKINMVKFHKKISNNKINRYFSNLNQTEMAIIAIIVGVSVALIICFYFGEHYDIYSGQRHYREDGKYFEFNYFRGGIGFIITAGITYLCLSKKNKK